MSSFKALILREKPLFSATVETITLDDLPNVGDVVVAVEWSGINYKDALAVTNSGKIVRGAFPFVPGIDLAGKVFSSTNPEFQPGDRVLSTGWGLGENKWGGYSEYQRLSSSSLIRLPAKWSSRDAMTIGTAGLTAMLAAMEIEKGPGDKNGAFLVTGATGGVGSFSVMALADLGYSVVASTGKVNSHPYLINLGASDIIERNELSGGARTLLDSSKWAGCVDSVGSKTLEAIVSQTARHGTIAVCGLAGGTSLETSVFPFILRGIRLIGIDSNTCPNEVRQEAWDRLCVLASNHKLDDMSHEVSLDGIVTAAEQLMKGKITGRIVVRVS
jgi:acrylyl-CoA reductase (NADPH)